MRILLISERLMPPYDEGIKNYAWQLSRALAQEHETLTLTAFCGDEIDLDPLIQQVVTNRLFASAEMSKSVRRFTPDLVLYVPTACATPASFARTRVLQRMAGKAAVVMIALQWRPTEGMAARLMSLLSPRLVLTQSSTTATSLNALGCRTATLPAQIDTDQFRPVDAAARSDLRRSYGLDPDAQVVLHVGHLNEGRNVRTMIDIQHELDVQGVVVGSSSTPHDASLVQELREAGVMVIDRYLDDVAKAYQMADCYLFPVQAAMSAIDLPLSVLEALACNLPVVTTRHAGLVSLFDETPGLVYADTEQDMIEGVRRSLEMRPAEPRALVLPLGNDTAVSRLLTTIQASLGQEELDRR